MKIAYVDILLDGHHMSYLKTLVKEHPDSILILPERVNELGHKQYILDSHMLYKHPLKYIKWMLSVKRIAEKEAVDVIHFLYGDVFYRYFGFGLKLIKNIKIIGTFHQIRRSNIKDISLKRIFRNINIGIVHTDSLRDDLNNIGINNICQIEYAQFNDLSKVNSIEAKRKLNLPKDVKIISAIGGTRGDKGLDILLESLNEVSQPFHLLIAGSEVTFSKEFIMNKIEKYKNNVTTILRYLTDEELVNCLAASDIIVLPYRKSFDGASGPLGEGVWLRKLIIGPNHGSLGKILIENNIGICFETENTKELTKAINKALKDDYKWSTEAENYRSKIDPKEFIEKYQNIYNTL